jgi:hypothetical protein
MKRQKQHWLPKPEWMGMDAFVLGGGPSLCSFDFSTLHGRCVVGCNAAFLLGVDVCSICFFSDPGFLQTFESQLCEYGGRVVTNSEEVYTPWVLSMPREEIGLWHDRIGFGYNSGCGAINLALILGARRVFLLGIDGHSCGLRSHWHGLYGHTAPEPDVYDQFRKGFDAVARDLPHKFPGREIINLNPDSSVRCFPFGDIEQVLFSEIAV